MHEILGVDIDNSFNKYRMYLIIFHFLLCLTAYMVEIVIFY